MCGLLTSFQQFAVYFTLGIIMIVPTIVMLYCLSKLAK